MIGKPDRVSEKSPYARPIMLTLVEAGRITLETLKARFYKISPQQVKAAGLSDIEKGVLISFGLVRTPEEDEFEVGFGSGPEMHVEIENSPTSSHKSLTSIDPLPTAARIDLQTEKNILKKLINAELLTLSTLRDLSLRITVHTADTYLTNNENAYLISKGLIEDEEISVGEPQRAELQAAETRGRALESTGAKKGQK